ncbi:AAA domain-containing protein [Sediminibacillus massiliensis]|uniref:AAA domain-containing protein n=1 Tax=Sediminibacillus massiliensis TaxID=1926277 RepID=UPI00098859D9|nr:AAA domain-containing protein [Sediminibacillus massiliensis]
MKQKMIFLKDRLNDLSRRNRSIRMLKKYDKWSFDLNAVKQLEKDPQTILENLLVKKTKVTLLKQNVNNKESLNLSGKLTTLFRNLKSIEEETGMYDLFIGYPFISGSMLDGTYVRAPLFLYPVKLERVKTHGTEWVVKPLEDAEPMLNRSVFLAMQKMSDLHVPDEIYEEAEEKAANLNLSDHVTWLNKYSLDISQADGQGIQAFLDYKKDTIPEFEKGEFQLDNLAILGHFPQGNSALLKDYEDFIQQLEEEDADLGLAGEVINVEDLDFSEVVDNLSPGEQSSGQPSKKAEKEKFFVLDTDASQEEIIESMETTKGLVIHGPPGTGKSQVIVNIIADAIAQQKKVLLVCQKRAALDVVYQRLDGLGLSPNVSLLHDEKTDRKALYQKLNTRLTIDEYSESLESEFEQLSNKIAKCEEELDAIAKGLYEVQPHGFRAFDLYSRGEPMTEQEVILKLENVMNDLNKDNLDDVLATIFSYGDNYKRFGKDDYPLKERKPFSTLEIKDRLTIVEVLKKATEQAKQSVEFLEHFDREDITPEYSWEVGDKLEKIYEDLNPEEKKTLQKLRLWWWTSFAGKTIVEELSEGDKFKGLSSKEWPKLRESLKILYDLSQVSDKMSKEVKQLSAYFTDDKVNRYYEQIAKGDIPLSELQKQQEYVIQDFEDLRHMDRIYDESLPFIKTIIDELKGKSEEHSQLTDQWVDIVEQSAYIHWIDEIERKHRVLTKVGTEEFEKLRENFKELLEKKKALSAKVLKNRLLKTLNEVKNQNGKAIKGIAHQTGKKRQVWPVRKLVQMYSLEGLLDVMPVWLVSPETASAIFPLEKELFDIVIFDEASQCTIENGIPAIYRGSQVIVAGDEKQLPPSSLFKGGLEADEDEEDENNLQESESLLNLAKRVFPSKMLQWHYRSKSEELINFSNHAFYNANMQIAPNVEHLKEPSSLQWHKVDGRWLNQCNVIEAKEVVNLLKELLIKNPNKSVGIITFNAKQQDKIIDYIDDLAENDEEFNVVYQQMMSKDMDERIFVKNIENVQGDERDIILFSIGYAKNKEGRVYSRFGTLGQRGGENRLNVAVTRAKEEIHLVSSIEPHELNVAGTKNDGPKFLKSYMEYALAVSNIQKETAESVLTNLNEEINTKRQDQELSFDSPFETQVYEQLTNIGYTVDTQVGMSGYRIDLAIVHPKDPEKYILGVECDGAMYHSAPSARERDIYRQRFLEGRGWKIARIWSRNWWKNPSTELEKIDQLIRGLVDEDKVKEKVKQRA